MGAQAYHCLCFYEPSPGCLVEVGAERGEGSTAYLYRFARRHGLSFYSADIDPKICENAEKYAPGRIRNTSGKRLLSRLRKPISVAYLDGFDWIPPGEEEQRWIVIQRNRYAALGVELENRLSEQSMLEEAELVAHKAAYPCVVVCDDTYLEDRWKGKGALAVPYLQSQGFEVVEHGERENKSLGYAVLKRD